MTKKKKKKRFKIRKLPILFLLVLIVILGLFMHYTSKTYLFTKAYNKTIKMSEESFKEFKSKYSPYIDSNYYLETSTVFDYNENNNKITGKIYIDGDNNYFDLNINKNKEESSLAFINKDGKSYYKLKDTYYYVDGINSSYSFNLDLSNIVSKYLKKYIKKGTISKKKELINYKDTYKTTKLTLKLTNKEFYNLVLDILKDKDIINIYQDSEKTIKEIEEKKKKEPTIKDFFRYSIYTYKGNPIQEEYEIGENVLNLSIFKYDDYKHIKFSGKESKKESYIIIDDNKIDVFIDGYLYGKGIITDNTIDITFTDYDKNEIGSLSYKIENENNIYNVVFKMNTKLDSLKMNIDINNKIDTSKSIPSIDLKGAKNITSASKEELEMFAKILTN